MANAASYPTPSSYAPCLSLPMPTRRASSTASTSGTTTRRGPFSPTLFAMEMRPIIGWRNPQWEFIVNPIVDFGFGKYGDSDFVMPRSAVPIARGTASPHFSRVPPWRLSDDGPQRKLHRLVGAVVPKPSQQQTSFPSSGGRQAWLAAARVASMNRVISSSVL
jgi:hypothetical protein